MACFPGRPTSQRILSRESTLKLFTHCVQLDVLTAPRHMTTMSRESWPRRVSGPRVLCRARGWAGGGAGGQGPDGDRAAQRRGRRRRPPAAGDAGCAEVQQRRICTPSDSRVFPCERGRRRLGAASCSQRGPPRAGRVAPLRPARQPQPTRGPTRTAHRPGARAIRAATGGTAGSGPIRRELERAKRAGRRSSDSDCSRRASRPAHHRHRSAVTGTGAGPRAGPAEPGAGERCPKRTWNTLASPPIAGQAGSLRRHVTAARGHGVSKSRRFGVTAGKRPRTAVSEPPSPRTAARRRLKRP